MPLSADVGRYGLAIAIMKYMGWSWQDLRSAPADLVQELVLRMSQESKWTAEREKLRSAMGG